MKTDVLIIGGGPAGLTAAYETASKGLDVILIEQTWSLGGQLLQQTQKVPSLPKGYNGGLRGFEIAQQLTESILSLRVKVLLDHTFIGLFRDGSVGVSNHQEVVKISCKKVVLATGAAEQAVPFPKWTLPGVMTVGAAQIFINREGIRPGNRAIIVGSNDLSIEIGLQLHEVGIDVLGFVEASESIKGGSQQNINKLKQLNIPIYLKTSVESVFGKNKVEKIYLEKENQITELNIDLVCTGGDLQPIIEPFQLLECDLIYEKKLGGWIPKYNTDFQTSNEMIYVAGNSAGITCTSSILLTGSLAGISVAESLGAIDEKQALKFKEQWLIEIKKNESSLNFNIWSYRNSILENNTNSKHLNEQL